MAETNIGGYFEDLPMSQLIGAPLRAAADAQVQLAGSAIEFMEKIGFNEDGTTKLLEFKLERPVETPTGIETNTLEVQAPFLGLVPIPALLVDDVDIEFQMEVTATTEERESENAEAGLTAEYKSAWGLDVEVSGKVTSSRENTRSTNQSAKYNVRARARQQPPTEGMSRLMDILAASTAPLSVSGVTE